MHDIHACATTRMIDAARRALLGAALVGACVASGGCLQSARHDFLALRADAPSPRPGARTSLAEALPSNIGPTAPPTALVEATDR